MKRKMVTVRTVTKVTKHPDADFLDICEVDGWNVITKLNEFQVGDKGFYFEIDSVVPTEDQRFAFLDNKAKHQILTNDKFERIEFRGFKIKTMKMKGVLSQGLLLPLSSINTKGKAVDPSKFKEDYDYAPAFKVIKFEPWLDARGNGQSKGNFPSIIQKTDQERIQNLKSKWDQFADKDVQITIKLDGSSLTAYKISDVEKYGSTVEDEDKGIYVGVCSRNLEIKESDDSAFWNVAKQFEIPQKLRNAVFLPNIAIQGEFISPSIQKNYEKVNKSEFHVFSVFDIDKQEYLKPNDALYVCKIANIKHVPIIFEGKLSDFAKSVDELLLKAEGPGMNPGVSREGIVIKALDGSFSFKAISNAYLCKEK